MKKTVLSLLLLLSIMLGGCWDYRGLDEMDIVTGIAIDEGEDGEGYCFTIEIIDLPAITSESTMSTKYIQSTGRSPLEGIRNAKRRLTNKLYLGNMQTILISHQLAETDGILDIIESFLRDGEPRETLMIAVSQEATAKEVLLAQGTDSSVVAYEMQASIEDDQKVTGSTINVPMHEAYTRIRQPGNVLVLPMFHLAENNNDIVPESNGIALFQDAYMYGYLDAQQSLPYLFMTDNLEGGMLIYNYNPIDYYDTSLEIKKSSTDINCWVEDAQVYLTFDITIDATLIGFNSNMDLSHANNRMLLERSAQEDIQRQVSELMEKAQKQIGRDIFGFGVDIYRHNPEMWAEIGSNWNGMFQNAIYQTTVKVNILSTGMLKGY